MKRKYIRKFLDSGGLFVLVLTILGIVAVVVLIVLTIRKSASEILDYWQVVYYSFAIFGSIGTMLAVIVALKKESLSKLLYSPDFRIEKDSSDVCPVKAKNNSSVVEKYSMKIKVFNDGTNPASKCKIEVLSVNFNRNRTGKKVQQLAINREGAKSLAFDNGNSIFPGKHDEFELFEVINPNVNTTPSESEDKKQNEARIDFFGVKLDPDMALRGKYEIEMRISCDEGETKDFTVIVDWAGGWPDDIEESKEKFSTTIR